MDSMSDELMLLILGHLDDGLTLLDVVPRVCKRWHRLSKDRGAWAGVVVTLGSCQESENCDYDEDNDDDEDEDEEDPDDDRRETIQADHGAIADAARVLLHAPALRRLKIDWSEMGGDSTPCWVVLGCDYQRRVTMSALRRCRAKVRELVMPQMFQVSGSGRGNYWMENPLRDLSKAELGLLTNLLVASRRSLRVLKLGRLLTHRSVEVAVSKLTRLRSLDLVLDDKYVACGLILRRPTCLPALRRLEVSCGVYINKCSAPAGVLADLLHGVAGRLRRLVLKDGCTPITPRVAAELRRCTELRELTCDAADLAVLPALQRLRTLDVSTFRDTDSGKQQCSPEDDAALAAATAALLALEGPLHELASLRVEVTLLGQEEQCWPALESLLELLASAASAATTLTLAFRGLPGVAELFLARMRKLRCVGVYDCPSDVLAALAELDGLERLSVNSWQLLPELDEKVSANNRLTVGDAVGRLRCLRAFKVPACPPSYLPLLATLPKLRELSVRRVECEAKVQSDCRCQAMIADFSRLRPDVKADLALGNHYAMHRRGSHS